MSERGFKYDALTEADDASIEANRQRIYACPCGMGRWVSIQTGTVYVGHGGSERTQWWLQSRGPWVLIGEDERLDTALRERNEAFEKYELLRCAVAEAIGAEL